ncbi:MAG: YadA C-terminal domain-containing protein [Megasphaera elsdenii]|nr:YadA C-terminal domain-containing protein [Megasphaera elsdenii]
MKLSGKKLTTAILAGLMGATVAGISVVGAAVGAANPVVLDGTTLKVSTIKGPKPIMNPVNVKKGIIDGTTTKGNIVKADSTVGANLNALDTAVVGKADKAALDAKANKTDFDALKTKVDNAKVDTALHVDKDGKLVVGTDKKVNKAVSVEKGFKDGTTEAGQGKIVSANNTVGQNLTALDTAIAANKQAADNALATKADQADLDEVSGQVDALQKDSATVKEGAALINANKDAIEKVGDHEKRINKEVVDRQAADQILQSQITYNKQAIGTTKDGNYVKASNSVGANLNALDAQVGQNSSNINQLFSDYSSMKTDINKVGARSAALAGLHPLDFDSANKLNFAVASGSFKGENSVALGAFYRPNENIMFSAASTMGDSDNAYTFGLSFKIGPSSAKTKTTSPDAEELYKVVGELQDQLAAQQKEIEQLKADKAK